MDKTTSKDGTPIAFDRVGHGPALILVDGALALEAAARLSSITRVAIYEAPFIVDDTHAPLSPMVLVMPLLPFWKKLKAEVAPELVQFLALAPTAPPNKELAFSR